MKRIRLILLAAMTMATMLVISGVGASSALAASGPLWLVNNFKECQFTQPNGNYSTLPECVKNENFGAGSNWSAVLTSGLLGPNVQGGGIPASALNLGNFVLHTSLITIICKHMHSEVALLGGVPAQDDANIHFLECEVEGHSSCTVNSPGASTGLILVTGVKTKVIYLGTKKEAEKEEGKLGDLFTPAGGATSGETFVELVIGGTGCPLFTKGEQEVKGSVIGEIAPVNSMAKEGKQIFPTTAIKEGWQWVSKGKVEPVEKVSLNVFGVIEAVQSGEADVSLNSGEEWGVTRS